MALLDRLIGNIPDDEPNVPIHEFSSILAEYSKGNITQQTTKDIFEDLMGFTTAELTTLQEFLDNLDASTITRQDIEDAIITGHFLLNQTAGGTTFTPTLIKNQIKTWLSLP